jgi:tetratricopeptide (TPR) repeat protein
MALKQARPSAPPPGASGQAAAPPNYRPAIDVFAQVTQLPPDTDDHRHVIDLAWMAVGRLFYEMEQYQQAADAYSHVSRESPEFDTMLYELAWVYVRLGDVERAERALEVLQVADPSSPYVGDGTLLRADLLLRAGAFDKALQLYEGVRTQYDPMRAKVEAFLDSTKDVGVYYDKLSQQQLDALDQNEQLPPLAVRWAREAEDGPAAFAVIDDVNECKTLIKQSNALIERLTVLTNAANRVRAFPELEAGEERALGLLNSVSDARLHVAKGLDDDEKDPVGAELNQVRQQRRAMMGYIDAMPISSGEFAARDEVGLRQWNTVSQELTKRNLEIDQLQAVVNGLRRMLKDDAAHGVARDPTAVTRFNAEIDANEHDLKLFRTQADELRRQIDFGRAQVGLGDSRYQQDAVARGQFRDLLEREVQLAGQGQGGIKAQAYSARVGPYLSQARSEEDRLIAAYNALEAQVATKTAELKAKIETERQALVGYAAQLDKLDNGQGGAHDLVGHVAERNFGLVREKLRGIVLRADVGITEQAWEVREEERTRVGNLQTERAREEQLLDEELREVLDDANNTTSGTGGTTR